MTAWDCFAWVGIGVTAMVAGLVIREVVMILQISRVGWTQMEKLGFWRSTWVVLTGPPWRIPPERIRVKPKPNRFYRGRWDL